MKNIILSQHPRWDAQNMTGEEGSVFLTTLIFMVLLTLIGVGGINIASTDLNQTRNYRIEKESLVSAEGAVNYAIAIVENALDRNLGGRDWVASLGDGIYLVEDLLAEGDKYFIAGSNYRPLLHPVTNAIDVRQLIDDWDSMTNIEPHELVLYAPEQVEYVAFIQISTGELDARHTSGVVIARVRRGASDVMVEKGIAYFD